MLDIVIDWDKGTEWSVFDGDTVTQARRADLLDKAFWLAFSNKTVGVEKAHFSPRGKTSLAQIYLAEELAVIETLAAKAHVRIRFIPQKLSWRAATEAYPRWVKKALDEANKGKGKDAKVRKISLPGDKMTRIYSKFFNERPQITLQNFPEVCDAAKAALPEIKAQTNYTLNVLRADKIKQKYAGPLVDHAHSIIAKSWARIPDAVKADYGIKRSKKGVISFNDSRVMTAYAIVRDHEGNLRLNPSGGFIGIDTCLRAVTQNPYGGKCGGTARSNIMHHFHKSFLKDVPREDWAPIRARMRRSLKTMLQVMRDG
jgi:hypothetical protein